MIKKPLRDPSTGQHSPSKWYYEVNLCLLNLGGPCHSFETHFKGVVLELLAHICKREKWHRQPWLLSIRGIPHCSRWGYRQAFWELSFPGQTKSVPYWHKCLTHPSVLTRGWRYTRSTPDGIPNLFLVPYHHNLCLICQVVSQKVSQASTTRESISLPCAHWHSWAWSKLQ